jgi:hypothetical protein
MRRSARWGTAALALALSRGAWGAVLTVGAGTSFDLGTAALNLGCADLSVEGTMSAGTVGFDQARHVTIGATGVLNGGSATLEVAGDWDNGSGGAFNAGTSSVNLVDGCGVSTSTILGSTTFASLTLTTATGKTYRLEAGSTQTIGAALSIAGTAGDLLLLRSTSAGSEATLDVEGSATIDFVDVQDLHASPNPIVFGPNSVLGTNIANASQCGDIDGNLVIEAADVTAAREHLVGKAISGDITLCNVVGPVDPLQSGADCGVDDILVLDRLASALAVTAENVCSP